MPKFASRLLLILSLVGLLLLLPGYVARVGFQFAHSSSAAGNPAISAVYTIAR